MQKASLAAATSPLGVIPSFVPLGVVNVAATEQGGAQAGNTFGQGGRVVVIGPEPLLEAWLGTNSKRMLTLYGNPGASYALGYRTNVLDTNWQFSWRTPMTNLYEAFAANATLPQVFYRAWEFSANPPILELANSVPTNLTLLLYGQAGTNYTLQATTNLSAGAFWLPATSFTLTNSFQFIRQALTRNPAQLFRAKRQ